MQCIIRIKADTLVSFGYVGFWCVFNALTVSSFVLPEPWIPHSWPVDDTLALKQVLLLSPFYWFCKEKKSLGFAKIEIVRILPIHIGNQSFSFTSYLFRVLLGRRLQHVSPPYLDIGTIISQYQLLSNILYPSLVIFSKVFRQFDWVKVQLRPCVNKIKSNSHRNTP